MLVYITCIYYLCLYSGAPVELTEQIQQQALNSPHIQGRFFIFYENQNVLYILILKPENDLGI